MTRKITRAVAAIKHGLQKELFLGNLDAKRDWGYAPEYVEGMWRIVQHDTATISSSRPTKRTPCGNSAKSLSHHVDLDWKEFVKHDDALRAAGGSRSAHWRSRESEEDSRLGTEMRFDDLVRIMVDADLELLSRQSAQKHLGKLP